MAIRISKYRQRKRTEKQELKQRIASLRYLLEGKLPKGAVKADLAEQVPQTSVPPEYYMDKPFTCHDCGSKEVWTASQQKWYYELAKGNIYGQPVRCRKCRRRHRENKGST